MASTKRPRAQSKVRGRPRNVIPPGASVSVRLTDALRARLKAKAADIEETTPGASASMASVIVAAIEAYCPAVPS